MYEFPQDTSKGYVAKGGLENLLKRLKKGMKLRGRIVEKFDKNKYLLRIWGYNILTESFKEFEKFEEVDFKVLQVTPHLVLDLFKMSVDADSDNENVDIIVE